MYNWLQRIKPNSVTRNIAILSSGTAIAQLIAVLISPLLTRVYTPADFGVLSVFVATLSVLAIGSCLRYELAIPLTSTDTEALNMLALSVIVNIFFGASITLVVALFGNWIVTFADITTMAQFIYALPIGIVAIGFYRAMTFFAIREKDIAIVAKTKVTQVIASIVTQLSLGMVVIGPAGLIAGHILSQSAGGLSLLRRFHRQIFKVKSEVSWMYILALAKKHYRYPYFDLPASILNTLSTNLPQFLLAVVFSPTVAGYYLLATRVISVPVAIMGQAVSQSIYAEARDAVTNRNIDAFVRRTITMLALIIIPPMIVVFFYAPPIFNFIFGTAWHQAGEYSSWLAIGMIFQFIYSPISVILLILNLQHIGIFLHSSSFLLSGTIILIGYLYADPLSTIKGLAFGNLIIYSIGILIIINNVKNKHLHV
jgi:O-antigen/teichoic acid export membrane protein